MATMATKRGREMRARRQFTDEFKAGAVALVLNEGKTIAVVARDLDLTPSALRGWVIQARADRDSGESGLTSDERAELAKLRKENRELKMERELLKKWAVHSTGHRNTTTSDSWPMKVVTHAGSTTRFVSGRKSGTLATVA